MRFVYSDIGCSAMERNATLTLTMESSLFFQNALQWAGIAAGVLLAGAVIGERIRRSRRHGKGRSGWNAPLDTREE